MRDLEDGLLGHVLGHEAAGPHVAIDLAVGIWSWPSLDDVVGKSGFVFAFAVAFC
jgi:hypothetical protein